MRNSWVIARKEAMTYFGSPMAYVIAAFYLVLVGYFFVGGISSPFAEASARGFLLPSTYVLVFWAPLLTMRLFAEEQKLGTLELLQTSPVRDWEMVFGKFMASAVILAGIFALTLYYVLLLMWFGDPDFGPLLSGYTGLMLYGFASLAVGLFASSLTSNQIFAGAIAVGILLFLSLADQAATLVNGWPSAVLNGMALSTHFLGFAQGLVSVSSIVFYVTFTAFFLLLAVHGIRLNRWR